MIILDQFTNSPLKGHFGNAYGLRSFMLYNENGGLIFLCNGANFINDVEHMTIGHLYIFFKQMPIQASVHF